MTRHITLFFIVLMLSCMTLHAQSWITMGGNSLRNGQSTALGSFPVSPIWSYDFTQPSFFSFNCYIDGDKLVTTNLQVDFTNFNIFSSIICLDLYTGQQIWTYGGPTDTRIALALNNGIVYGINWVAWSDEGQPEADFYALDVNTGSVLWNRPELVHAGAMDWWYPVFTANGDVIVSGANFSIISLNHQTGATNWELGAPSYTFPITGGAQQCAVVGNKIYALKGYFMEDLTIVAIDSSLGVIMYESPSLDPNTDQQIPLTASSDGKIFVMLQDGGVCCYQDTNTGFQQVWFYPTIGGNGPVGPLCNFGLSQDNQHFYVTDGDKTLNIKVNNGALEAQSASNSVSRGITVDANDFLYTSSMSYEDGYYLCLDSQMNEIWRISAPWNCDASLSIGPNNILIIPQTTGIYAYQAPPQNLEISRASEGFNLSWDMYSNINLYNVYFSSDPLEQFNLISTTNNNNVFVSDEEILAIGEGGTCGFFNVRSETQNSIERKGPNINSITNKNNNSSPLLNPLVIRNYRAGSHN